MAVERSTPIRSPKIDGDEEEEPHNVNEVPVPSSKFETEMLLRREMTSRGAQQAHCQEDRSDDHMESVKSGRHEEGRTINMTAEREWRMRIFISLHAGEDEAENNRQPQALLQTLTIIMQKRVMIVRV